MRGASDVARTDFCCGLNDSTTRRSSIFLTVSVAFDGGITPAARCSRHLLPFPPVQISSSRRSYSSQAAGSHSCRRRGIWSNSLTPSTRHEYRRHLCSCNGNGCTTQTVIKERTVCLAIHHLIETRDRYDLFNLTSIKGLLMPNLEYWKTRGLVIRRHQHIQQDGIHSCIWTCFMAQVWSQKDQCSGIC